MMPFLNPVDSKQFRRAADIGRRLSRDRFVLAA